MSKRSTVLGVLAILLVAVLAIAVPVVAAGPGGGGGNPGRGGGGNPGGGGGGGGETEVFGNNLSYPVIWAEGVTKTLRGTLEMDPSLAGEYWWWWGTEGTDPNVVPLSCPSDGIYPANDPDLVKAWLQKDQFNTWQAFNGTPTAAGLIEGAGLIGGKVAVDWIDWGDNLESVDWYTKSQVRTEVVLFKSNPNYNAADPNSGWLEYQMRHVSGWGIDEVHGLATTASNQVLYGTGEQATVYSDNARLTIQKLTVPREDVPVDGLTWNPVTHVWDGDYVNSAIFNKTVYEGGDGPGYYSAEINVKGRVIYGYTWNVRTLNDMTGDPLTPAGDYRVTFSLDEVGTVTLNTTLEAATILVPLETEVVTEADDGSVGGTAHLVDGMNVTYIDVRILARSGGGGGGGGGKPQ